MKNLLPLLAILFISETVQAAAISCDTYNNPTIVLPNFIQSSTDVKKLQVISSEWHENATPTAMTCKTDGDVTVESIIKSPGTDSGIRINVNGINYIVYSTGDPKIGVIAEVADSTNYLPLTFEFKVIYTRTLKGALNFTLGSKIRVKLVALDSLPMGPYFFTGMKRLTWHGLREKGPFGMIGASIAEVSSSTINTKNTACTLDLPPTVKLKKADISVLSGTTKDPLGANFKITVNCKALNTQYTIDYLMTDTYNPTNNSNILSLSGEPGQASGVGLKIMDEGSVVTYGESGNTSALRNFGAMVSNGGSITKNMEAVYTRTAATVGAGMVRAGATITLSYK